ncbi:hypothetical protein VSDG_07596 [Cytospora chrysosperma]|uniref:Uncharacterized protein n=1 Tax=Cytospora chrysosperma TaxID=252740 RepID=A0A423VLS1_CYTCH|nr:hypothetical protein VSDG_07596 [Valsa sordida]
MAKTKQTGNPTPGPFRPKGRPPIVLRWVEGNKFFTRIGRTIIENVLPGDRPQSLAEDSKWEAVEYEGKTKKARIRI